MGRVARRIWRRVAEIVRGMRDFVIEGFRGRDGPRIARMDTDVFGAERVGSGRHGGRSYELRVLRDELRADREFDGLAALVFRGGCAGRRTSCE